MKHASHTINTVAVCYMTTYTVTAVSQCCEISNKIHSLNALKQSRHSVHKQRWFPARLVA